MGKHNGSNSRIASNRRNGGDCLGLVVDIIEEPSRGITDVLVFLSQTELICRIGMSFAELGFDDVNQLITSSMQQKRCPLISRRKNQVDQARHAFV